MLFQPRWVSVPVRVAFVGVALAPVAFLLAAVLGDAGPASGALLGKLLLSSRQVALLGTSVGLAAMATALAVAMGLPYAALVTRGDVPGRALFRRAYLLPLLVPPYVQAIVWERLLGSATAAAPAPSAVEALGTPAAWGAAWTLALVNGPFFVLLATTGLESVDRRSEEAAVLCGRPWRAFLRVTLPLAAPHLAAGALFVFVFSLVEFSVPDLFRLRVYPVEIFVQFSGLYDEQAAAILALPLVLLTTALVVAEARHMRGRSYFSPGGREGARPSVYALGKAARWVGTLWPTAYLALSLAVPLARLAAASESWSRFRAVVGASLDELRFSLGVAVACGVLATALGFLLAHFSERRSPGGRSTWSVWAQVPFAIPAGLLGVALIRLWNRPVTAWMYGTAAVLVLGHVARCIPFCVRTLAASIGRVPPALEEAGHLAGHGWLGVSRRIVLPLCRRGLLASFLVAFVLSLGDIAVSVLVAPPGGTTLMVKIYNHLHYGGHAEVASLSLFLVALQVGAAALFWAVSRWVVPAGERIRC